MADHLIRYHMRMRIVTICLLAAFLASPAAFALSGNVAAADNVTARLVSEVSTVAPGQSFWVALDLEIRDGWHTYWRNPGDSGQATSIKWRLPPGFSAGDIVWTAPHRFDIPPLVNYGYSGHAVHLIAITAPKDLQAGVAVLSAAASWLVCSDVCIPQDAELELKLPVSARLGALDPKDSGLFAAARSELPGAAPAGVTARIDAGRLVVTLGQGWGATLPQIKSLVFFPYDDGAIEYAAPQTLAHTHDGLELAMKLGDRPPRQGLIRGVLVATERSGSDTVSVPLEIAAALPGSAGMAAAAGAAEPTTARAPMSGRAPAATATQPAGMPLLLLFAALGGLILNLMPCVFPVLSIKAIGLVEQAKWNPAAVRAKGLMFAAGVIASMLCLGAAMLALRAGGEQIGWGFQLQSPLFVTLLVYLLLAVGLNLSGVFEIGGSLAGVGDGLTQGHGLRASFFTGVLTTLVAAPCSAPYMAFAVGAALTLPPAFALCIFAALGLGLSLPYLLLSFAPVLRRSLPRPGAWMDTLKQLLAFPIYASAAWLLWVLAQQTTSFGLGAALGGAILIALAAWAYQKSKSSGRRGRVAALAAAALAVLCALILPVRFADVAAAPAAGAQVGDGWRRYDPVQAAELESTGRPLLINFTASWCLTCLVNERNAFADPGVLEIFRDKSVVLMKGDWTNRDPAITQALAAFGRAGVPLYLVYNARPGATGPIVLPQLLTAGVIRSAFAAAPAR